MKKTEPPTDGVSEIEEKLRELAEEISSKHGEKIYVTLGHHGLIVEGSSKQSGPMYLDRFIAQKAISLSERWKQFLQDYPG